QHFMIAFAQVDRLQKIKVERILNLAAGVPRRELQIHEYLISRIFWIQLTKGLSGDLLVLPDAGPRISAECRRLLRCDLDLLYVGVSRGCRANPVRCHK